MDPALATATRTLMRIENVELANMRTFANANYKIPTGLSLVTGQNGTGKSTILGIAAAWVMWGQTPGRTQDFLVRHGEREMVGKLTFNSNGTEYVVTRRFRLNKNGKGGVTQLLLTDKSDLTKATVKETQATINSIAGSFEVWQMTAYVGQREGAGQFLEANAYERKGILREIVAGTGDWDQWELIAKQRVTHYESEILRIEGAIPVIAEAAEPLDAVSQTLAAARLLGVESDIALEKASSKLKDSSAAVDRGRKIVVEWKDRDDRLAAAQIQATTCLASINKIDTNIAELQKSAAQLSSINSDYDTHQKKIADRQAEIDKVRLENERIREAQHNWNYEYDRAIARWQSEVEQFHKDIANHKIVLNDEIAAAEIIGAAIEELENSTCRTCNQPLTGKRREELDNIIANGTGWEGIISGARKEIAELEKEIPPARPADKTMPAPFDVPSELGQDERIIELRAKAANAGDLIQTQQIQKNVLVGEANEIEVNITNMKRWIETTERPESNYLERLIATENQALENERVSLEARDMQRVNVALGEQALAAAKKAKTQLSNYRNLLGEHKTELHQWETVVLMCGVNGIRQLIIDQALAQLEPACNRWLAIIAPEFEIAFSTQTDTDRETFDEGVILPSGAIQPWSELSGAQSVAVALAVRLGLAEVGGAAQGIHYETLYLDEADAWLTGNYQQQFMNMLAKVADTGIDVVAITHIETVKQMVDQQIEIVSNGNESRIK